MCVQGRWSLRLPVKFKVPGSLTLINTLVTVASKEQKASFPASAGETIVRSGFVLACRCTDRDSSKYHPRVLESSDNVLKHGEHNSITGDSEKFETDVNFAKDIDRTEARSFYSDGCKFVFSLSLSLFF